MSSRRFCEVYKALDKDTRMYVAVKKMKLPVSEKESHIESYLLMKCDSPFIVRYNRVIHEENELWVMFGRRG